MNDLTIKPIINNLNLSIQAIVKPQFNQTYALAMVDFGSLDTLTRPRQLVPAGSAHFLEHKLFAKPDLDSDRQFAQFGADSNAFTSYTKTAYLFKCVGHVAQNLGVLLDLISRPYFTKDNIAREQQIIAQEIQMYADSPDWFLEQVTLNNLYVQDPIAEDIAGSLESISQIDATTLLQIYQQYYIPQNFQIYLAGNVAVAQLEQQLDDILQINTAIQTFAKRSNVPTLRMSPQWLPVKSSQLVSFQTKRPRMMLGLRIDATDVGSKQVINLQNQLELLMAMILGETAVIHQNLLDQGLIDDTFGYSVIAERQYVFILISAQTAEPQRLGQVLRDYLLEQRFSEELTLQNLEAVKHDSLGSYLFAQDYMENLATESAELAFYDLTYVQVLNLINQISIVDIQSLASKIFQEDNLTITYLKPEN
ncbi:insulinase family protein [Bombilactobacillus folatiphilus]|uniref:Insulinase family protein n=1 Tax=Bombilactobacillus folatiphilus TaxID=2923362 RepID=A0ABY4P7M3_9LACO|nr:pitrilysin family protein [Bombilactobacillus folatiphilus]UQS81708.1 insulinase family protein [Bombilactobacillus folatiphilus]